MPKRIVDKLVRDKIVEQMEAQGKKVTHYNLILESEKKQKLTEKLGEKYKELFESLIHQEQNKDKVIDGIADMLEIMNKIAQVREVDLKQVMARKKQKLDEKGGYENFVFIKHVEE